MIYPEVLAPNRMNDIFLELNLSKQHSLKKNTSLFRQGDLVKNLYAIKQGSVRMLRHTIDGTESIIYDGLRGDSFAEASLFSSHYHCEALAIEDSILNVYPKDEVLAFLTNNPQRSINFMSAMARQVQQLRTHLTLRNIKSARERIYRYIIISADSEGLTKVTGSLKDLAIQLGLAHETFYRELSKLEKEGLLIRNEKGDIIVSDT